MKQKRKSNLSRLLFGVGRLSQRIRNINILLFLLAFSVMAGVMLTAFSSIISGISSDYAGRSAASSADSLSARITKEISLLAAAARSNAVTGWLMDEDNEEKQSSAYNEMLATMNELYSNNLYVVVGESLNEYKIEDDYSITRGFFQFDTLHADAPLDAWYFDSITTDNEYMLNVAMDRLLERKRVWINYTVKVDGVPIGLLCTGLEFSHIAGELFSIYDFDNTRGMIIDENGLIIIDSYLLEDEVFLHQEIESMFEDAFSEPALIEAMWEHLDGINGHFEGVSAPVVIKLTSDPYHFATIAPIRHTNWSAVIIYDSSSSLDIPLFIPITVAMLFVLIIFALATNAISYRLIFLPLGKLRQSLSRLKEDKEEDVYGSDRDDELGELSNAIMDWFNKANYDALTGIHNRRYMENNFQHIMEYLSRSGGVLSVFMVDVDYFKKYNDNYGHEQGDVCLKTIAQSVNSSVTRTGDFAARYGGEEFALILPSTDKAGACLVADKLLDIVRSQGLPHAASDVADFVTVSVGVTTGCVKFGQRWEEYIKRADEALYLSKQNGRNRYTFLAMDV